MAKRDTKTRVSPKGLRNKGNDCFLNSAMQCFMSLVDLTSFYSSASFSASQRVSKSLQDLISLFRGPENVVSPENFIRQVGSHIKILNGRQQDSHEFLLALINLLFKELWNDNKEVYEDVEELRMVHSKNFIAGTFYGMLQTSVICNACLRRFRRQHHFSILTLNISTDVEESLKIFVRESVLEKDNKWACESCHLSKSSVHKIEIVECSKVLIIHLIRFEGGYRKDNRGIDINEEICLGDNTYEVIGIVCHTGVLNSGHYISYTKRAGGWYCFDDENVSKMDIPPLKSSNAYLIFYQKK